MIPTISALHSPPHMEPVDVPVLIDDVKHLEDFNMTRCTYFTIDAGSAIDDWVTMLRGRGVPFLLLGMSPVIFRPELDMARFEHPDQIDLLFYRIEQIEGLVVETSHIWLPNEQFGESAAKSKLNASDHPPTDRGILYRVSLPLFQIALQFQREVISSRQFAEDCQRLMSAERPSLEHGHDETRVFDKWSKAQIEAARFHYQRQKEDPDRQVLEWRDEYGNLQPG